MSVSLSDDSVAVRCLGLTRRFGALVAVDHLDLSVAHSEIFALVGPDGAGKTTLIRMLCGALTPTEGAAVVAGADVARDPEAVKARIGYMPQRFSLYGDLSVMENLRLYGDIYGVARDAFREQAARLLADFRLDAFTERPAQQVLRGHALVHSLEVFGDRLHVLVDSADQAEAELQRALRSGGVQALSIRRTVPSLEDVFVSRLARSA